MFIDCIAIVQWPRQDDIYLYEYPKTGSNVGGIFCVSLSCFKSACGWLYFLVDVYDRIDTDKFQVFCAALINMIYLTVSEELADTLVRILSANHCESQPLWKPAIS